MVREDTPGPDPTPRSVGGRSGRPAVIVGLSLAALGVAACWLVFSATRPQTVIQRTGAVQLLTVDRPFPADGRFPGDRYAGTQVCAECHPAEAALHFRSGHSSTLLPAGRRAVSRRLDGKTITDPERPEVAWSYQFRDGHLRIARTADGQSQKWVVDYAFGSGHHATTFVNVLDASIPSIFEHRLTYFAQEAALAITPGQDVRSRVAEFTPDGNKFTTKQARKCIRCHSTQMSARGDEMFDEDTMIPNVSCERCHGPSRGHVLAASRGAGESDLSLPFGPDRFTSEELLTLCGACHRHPSGARPGQIRPDNPFLARFQPVGLMQSKCYVRSARALNCVTCHDPHARASADRASYDTKCLECHGAYGPAAMAPGGVPSVVCSVSPRERCVECHMPQVDSGQHILFSDHWIRIRRQGESSLSIPTSVPGLDLLAPD
jgi:Cytochrome c554 and c-prime